jgi:hypothetical protein
MNRLLLLIFLIITGPMAQAVMLSTDGGVSLGHGERCIEGRFDGDFQLSATSLSTGEQVEWLGLPVTGPMLQNDFNANAAPGLLAKYGAVQLFSFKTVIEESQP